MSNVDWENITVKIEPDLNKLDENMLRSAYGYLARFDLETSPYFLIGKIEKTQRKQAYNLSEDHTSVWYDDKGERHVVYPFLDAKGHDLAKNTKLRKIRREYSFFIRALKKKGVKFI